MKFSCVQMKFSIFFNLLILLAQSPREGNALVLGLPLTHKGLSGPSISSLTHKRTTSPCFVPPIHLHKGLLPAQCTKSHQRKAAWTLLIMSATIRTVIDESEVRYYTPFCKYQNPTRAEVAGGPHSHPLNLAVGHIKRRKTMHKFQWIPCASRFWARFHAHFADNNSRCLALCLRAEYERQGGARTCFCFFVLKQAKHRVLLNFFFCCAVFFGAFIGVNVCVCAYVYTHAFCYYTFGKRIGQGHVVVLVGTYKCVQQMHFWSKQGIQMMFIYRWCRYAGIHTEEAMLSLHTCVYIHTYIHTYIHSHIHTYIQTYIHICAGSIPCSRVCR